MVGAEGEVGRVGLGETRAIGAPAGVDAAGGDVAPGDAGLGAGLGDGAGEHGVAHQALRLVELTGVDVGFAGVAGGVDQELRLLATEQARQRGPVGVVKVSPADIAEGQALAREQRLVCRANVTGASK